MTGLLDLSEHLREYLLLREVFKQDIARIITMTNIRNIRFAHVPTKAKHC
jgi:hypothetical protein